MQTKVFNMGKKNKAKAHFSAQCELISTLRTAYEPLPADTPVFSISMASNGPYSNGPYSNQGGVQKN